MLSNNALCLLTAAQLRVTIFNTGGKFQLVSNFTELHTLTLAACPYATSSSRYLLGGYCLQHQRGLADREIMEDTVAS